jgi:putative FmdB family regulatory protein
VESRLNPVELTTFIWEVAVPIYAYKCSDCGHAQDVLQKMSDPLLEDCPECKQKTYVKQVTAAGFHLKGTGWYVTDFRDGGKAAAGAASSSSDSASSGSSASGSSAESSASTSASTSAPSSGSSPAVS